MSTKVIPPIVLLDAVSLAATVASRGVHTLYSDNIGIQYTWTGTPTGVFGVDVCNDATLNTDGTVSGGTWTPLVFTSPEVPEAAGASGNGFIDLNQTGAAFVRATYTRTSGTGNLTAILSGKPV